MHQDKGIENSGATTEEYVYLKVKLINMCAEVKNLDVL